MSSSMVCDAQPTLLGDHTEKNVTGLGEN